MSTPNLLKELVHWMQTEMYVELYNEDEEGRTNSTIGESQIVETLILDSPFNVAKAKKRGHEDFILLDDLTITSDLKIVDRDDTNAQNFLNGPYGFSHLLFGKHLNWKAIHRKVQSEDFNEHYSYILCINQDNPRDIMLREFGEFAIENYKVNPSNPVQLDLSKEWNTTPTIRNNRTNLIINLIEEYFDSLVHTRGQFLIDAVNRKETKCTY